MAWPTLGRTSQVHCLAIPACQGNHGVVRHLKDGRGAQDVINVDQWPGRAAASAAQQDCVLGSAGTQLQALLAVRGYDTCRLSACRRMYGNGRGKTLSKLDGL